MKFLAEKAPANYYNGGNVQDIYFYRDGEIVASFYWNNLDKATIENEGSHISKVNTYSPVIIEAIRLREVKKAVKLNLNRTDNFIIKTASDSYAPKPYDLYIYVGVGGDVKLIRVDEIKYMSPHDGEQAFMNGYMVKFCTGADYVYNKYERIVCDDYTLEPGEFFSEHGSGTKEAKAVRPFDTSAYMFNKNRKPEKGVIKSWRERETKQAVDLIAGQCSRHEKSEERKHRDQIAEVMSQLLHKNITASDVATLSQKFDIVEK